MRIGNITANDILEILWNIAKAISVIGFCLTLLTLTTKAVGESYDNLEKKIGVYDKGYADFRTEVDTSGVVTINIPDKYVLLSLDNANRNADPVVWLKNLDSNEIEIFKIPREDLGNRKVILNFQHSLSKYLKNRKGGKE